MCFYNLQIRVLVYKNSIQSPGLVTKDEISERRRVGLGMEIFKREYDLKMAGYEVLRFSGSQIYNEPFKCAEDTYNYIMKIIKEE